MKRISSILLLTFLSTTIFAQEEKSFHFGLKAAPSLAWLKSDTEGFDSDGSTLGFSYGLITDFNFADRYAFGTGIDITYRGGKFKSLQELKTVLNEDSIVSTKATYSLQYLEVPLTLKLKTNEIGSLTYFLQIGVVPGWVIRARRSFESTTQTTIGGTVYDSNDSSDKQNVLDDINNVNVSMVIGAGLEYTLSGQTVLLAGLHFSNGFSDVYDGDPKINSNYLALTLGVLF